MFDARTELQKVIATHQPFQFTDLDGNVHTLTNVQMLTGEQVERLGAGDDTLIEELNPEAYAAIKRMPVGVGELLAESWMEAGGDSGKLPSDSVETESVGTPSEETSPPEA